MADYVVIDKEQLEADLTTVSDSIRGLLETEEKLEFPQGMKEAIESYSLDEPLEAQDALIEQIKTALQGKASGGGEDNLVHATMVRFKDLNLFEKDSVVLHLYNVETLADTLSQTVINTTVKILEIYCNNKIANINFMCSAHSSSAENALKKIILYADTSQCVNFNGIVWKQVNLEEIAGTPLDFTSATTCSLIFNNCDNLKEVRFKPNTISCNAPFNGSANFTNETIESIINGLVDLNGSTSKILTLHQTVKSKLTEVQLASITSKNWTLA